jgi:MFS family permease
VAFYALLISCICCLISPWLISSGNILFVPFILIWGTSVAADSPQFSALVAATAPAEQKGTALTFVICIGFAITILSIYVTDQLVREFFRSPGIFAILSIGPVLGLICMSPLLKRDKS